MNLRTLMSSTTRRSGITGTRPPLAGRRPAMYLATAAVGAVVISVVTAGEPPAEAGQIESVSVAEQLGISAEAAPVADDQLLAPLERLAASRSERDAERAAAVAAQAAADQAEADRLAAEEAARIAAEEAARVAAEEAARAAAEAARAEEARAAQAAAAAARPGQGTSAPAAPSGSYKEYALSRVGGGSEFTCLENLWGKESGWNPNAQNPTSTAYGIAQFLNSTWAGTGIAKTSDGYRQIDAGLIYINNRFGSPCGAWSHSQAKGWY